MNLKINYVSKKTNLLKKLSLSWQPAKGRGPGKSLTTYYRGGKTFTYYNIDYKYANYGKKATEAVILDIKYLDFKSNSIGIILYLNGPTKGYQNLIPISSKNIIGDLISFGKSAPNKEGNSKPLYSVPIGSFIFNLEMSPGQGGSLIKTSGSYGQLLHIQNKFAYIQLPSKQIKLILKTCFCSLGVICLSKSTFSYTKSTKAGYNIYKGRRSKVRGVAMNPIDHPHGGGTGKSSIKKKLAYSRWGMPSKGIKTKKLGNKNLILKRVISF